MSFGGFSGLKAKIEHITGVVKVLSDGQLRSPQEIAVLSGLSQTQVRCALNELEAAGRLSIVRQKASPKVRVTLADSKPSGK